MPVTVARDANVFILRAEGTYTAAEMIRAFDGILATPGFPGGAAILLDVRRSESVLSRPVAEMRAITGHFERHAARFGNRVGLLVDGGARYGLMRMASAWVGMRGIQARVDTDPAPLIRWLKGTAAEPAGP